jgi:hypothetical protein
MIAVSIKLITANKLSDIVVLCLKSNSTADRTEILIKVVIAAGIA